MTTRNPNFNSLREWMESRDITVRSVAERLDVSPATASTLLRGETMPVSRHAALVGLGFSRHLLPAPIDRKPGRSVKIPRFPIDENFDQ